MVDSQKADLAVQVGLLFDKDFGKCRLIALSPSPSGHIEFLFAGGIRVIED
jgi:hypothetical protein